MHSFDTTLRQEPLELLRRWTARRGCCQHFGGIGDMLAIAGAPASGKKRLARSIAEKLGLEVLHLAMETYAFADDLDRLLGEKGRLRTWIEQHPQGCVVFENVDEADHSIQKALADIVENGADDAPGLYRGALFLFTFKIKAPEWLESDFIDRYYAQPLLEQARLYEALSTVGTADENGGVKPLFDPSLLNVLSQTDLLLLHPHTLEDLRHITETMLQTCLDTWRKNGTVDVTVPHPKPLAFALLLSFSPYLNSTRLSHRLPAYLYDLVAGNETCLVDVSKDVRNWLRRTFASEADLKSFGKYDRRFHLLWERAEENGQIVVRLRSIEERSNEKHAQDYPFDETLQIHPANGRGFERIAGQSRVKKQLRAMVELLNDDEGLRRFGITLPKGMLLHGPQGVGKTLLVKAFADEAKLPYIYLHGSDLFDESLIEEAYQRARLAAPLLVILDNIDVKGLINGNYTPVPTEALENAIDRSPDTPGRFVFTVMTAQDKEEVPKSLMHPGRIDQFVDVPELDREARLFFAKKLLEKPHADIDVERITRYMSGMNGYELERIAKACALEAIRQGKERLDEAIVINEINTIKYGTELDRKRLKNFEEDLRNSAWHEAAHAVVSLELLPETDIEQVTVIPRTEALGLVSYDQEHIQTNMSVEEIKGSIAVALAGRLSTIKKFGRDKGLDTGAYSDLQQATLLAYSAVAQYGMDEALPNIDVELLQQSVSRTLFTRAVERCVARWIDEGTQTAQRIIDGHWELIGTLARRLIDEEYIEGRELKRLFDAAKPEAGAAGQ